MAFSYAFKKAYACGQSLNDEWNEFELTSSDIQKASRCASFAALHKITQCFGNIIRSIILHSCTTSLYEWKGEIAREIFSPHFLMFHQAQPPTHLASDWKNTHPESKKLICNRSRSRRCNLLVAFTLLALSLCVWLHLRGQLLPRLCRLWLCRCCCSGAEESFSGSLGNADNI